MWNEAQFKRKTMITISIDPSSNSTNGVCIRDREKIIEVKIMKKLDVLKMLFTYDYDLLIVEDSRKKGAFRKNSGRRVGVLDGTVKDYEKSAKDRKKKVVLIAPCGLNKSANTLFPAVYSRYKDRTEHEKVAILLFDVSGVRNIKL